MVSCEDVWTVYKVSYYILCIAAILFNGVNMVVLTRLAMISPTVVLLIWISAVTEVNTFFWLMHHYKQVDTPIRRYLTYIDIGIVRNITLGLYSVIVWLVVALVVFRAAVVRFPTRHRRWCSIARVNVVSVTIVILVTTIYAPITWKESVIEQKFRDWENMTDDGRNSTLQESLTLWEIEWTTNAACLKLLPCVLIVVCNGFLIRSMLKNRSNGHHGPNVIALDTASTRSLGRASGSLDPVLTSSSSAPHTDTAFLVETQPPDTALLVETQPPDISFPTRLILVLGTYFTLTEIPRGALRLFWIFYVVKHDDEQQIIPRWCLNTIFQYTTMVGFSASFFLYCTMSKAFRRTLIRLLLSVTVSFQNLCKHQRSNSY